MRNKIDLKKSWFYLFLCLFCFTSCEQELDKYYEVPGSLKGNAKELLESRGNFSIFLKGVLLTGYSDMISGKGIKTVLAPTDEAFNKWLADNGYSSIESVPLDELNKLITFHLVYYSYDKTMFANYRPLGVYNETEDAAALTAGLYFKFRTHSRDTISSHIDQTTAPGAEQVERLVFHYDRFVPVFSSYMFNTKGIDAAYNYQYFYPENTWTGQDGGFCVSNSSVDEYAIIADNGYVYVLDEVLTPLETIHTELAATSNYSTFLKMYDRFITYVLDEEATEDYGNENNQLYLSVYLGGLAQIGWEWPTNLYSELATLARYGYNVFAPTNTSLDNFFQSYWGESYATIDDVPFTPLKYLLQNHIYTGDIVFPEEISAGKITSTFGTAIDFDPQNTDLRQMCANGTLYGLNNLMVPRMFESVTAPLFQKSEYNPFLLMMDASNDLIPALMSANVSLSLFVPNQTVLLDNTTIDGSPMSYVNQNPNLYGAENIYYENSDGQSVPLSSSRKSYIASNHVAELVSSVGTNKIFSTLNSYQYLYLDEAEGLIYSTDIWNNMNNRAPSVRKIYDAYNGSTYELYGDDGIALTVDANQFKEMVTRQLPEEMTAFRDLLIQAGFTTTSPSFNFLTGNRFIILMPQNSQVEAGIASGIIPTDQAELAQYLKYYMINVNTSNLSGYLFPGTGLQGTMNTFRYEGRDETQLTVIDTGSQIQVRDAKGSVANVVSVFPNIYNDGAAYIIDGLLEFE